MTAPNPPATRKPHRNHGLFSDHYLNVTLPERPGWGEMAVAARPAMEEIASVFDSYVPSDNEAQTERDLVRRVLDVLGHHYEVQPALKTPDGTKRPDYVFYKDAAAVAANKDRTLDDDVLRGSALAVGDAKYWDRPLDVSLKGHGDPFSNKNPSYQISFYMLHAGTEWGILTNGRLWRLYHENTAHKLDRYYEVDLHELVTGGDAERFLYF
jgi:hypothetical protein